MLVLLGLRTGWWQLRVHGKVANASVLKVCGAGGRGSCTTKQCDKGSVHKGLLKNTHTSWWFNLMTGQFERQWDAGAHEQRKRRSGAHMNGVALVHSTC